MIRLVFSGTSIWWQTVERRGKSKPICVRIRVTWIARGVTKKGYEKTQNFFVAPFLLGGERGIRTPVTVFAVNMISNHAPSTTRTPLHDALVLSHGIGLVTDTRILYSVKAFLSSFFSENI